MKPIAFTGVLLITLLIAGCGKKNVESKVLASLSVIHALIGNNDLKINSIVRDSIRVNSSKTFGLAVIDGNAAVRVWPTSDSIKPYYQNTWASENGDIYSLFLHGRPGSVTSILIKEQIPERYNDSVIGVRVAHLSLGTGTLNINLKSDTTTSLLQGINYATVTDIVKVPLLSKTTLANTTFEVRDVQSKRVLATYTLPASPSSSYPGISIDLQRFKNITLVIKGSPDSLVGPNSLGAFPVALTY